MNRESVPRGLNEGASDSETKKKPGFIERLIGRKVMRGAESGGDTAGDDAETAESDATEEDLKSVTAKILELGNDETKRTPENFVRLVNAATLPDGVKSQLISEYQAGDRFDSLILALRHQEVEVADAKEARREALIEKARRRLTAAFAIGAVVLVVGGVVGVWHGLNSRVNGDVNAATDAPVKIMDEVEEVVSVPDESGVAEISILDDETLYTNSNYENFEIGEIGKAVVDRYMDTGEGYEVSENGIAANFSDYNDFENKSSRVAFGTEISDDAIEGLQDGDSRLYIDESMTKYVNNPAIASAHVSVIDPAMDYLGVPDEIQNIDGYGERAQAVWDWVREQGVEKNEEVMGIMYVNMKADTTKYQVAERTGSDWTMYETVTDPSMPMSIENAKLMGQSRIERDAAVQVTTTLAFSIMAGEGGDENGSKDSIMHEIEVSYTDNGGCGGQLTGPVLMRNLTTDVTVVDIPVPNDDEQEQEQTETETETKIIEQQRQQTSEEETETETETATEEIEESSESETPQEEVPAESETPQEEDETPSEKVEPPKEEVKTEPEAPTAKDKDSLISGVDQALKDAGSNNVVTPTPNIDTLKPTPVTPSTSESENSTNTTDTADRDTTVVATVTSNDGTTAGVNSSNEVVEVTDGKSNETVEVTSGDTTPTYDVTEKTQDEVKNAVNEGKEYTEAAESQPESSTEAVISESNDNDSDNGGGNGETDTEQSSEQSGEQTKEQRENAEADELMSLLGF